MITRSMTFELAVSCVWISLFLLSPIAVTAAFPQEEDYLTEKEIAKLREEFQEPSPRIELLASFLQKRFQHARELKAGLIPLPAKVSSVDPAQKGKKKEKPKKENAESETANEEVDPEEELGPQTFLEWMHQFSACLADVEMNLKELPSISVDLKPMLKVMKKMNQDLAEQGDWVKAITPMLKGAEKRMLEEVAEIHQDVTEEVREYLQALEAEQERLKQEKKKGK